ncbi:40S ribosomal protein mrp10 [Friedmanniomyces endolithicus]|nr:40S ribosomal protein mrp10 [Friedmanniomyces endolithicus]KAK1814144.1 40S ribosomal protein mrp10 [Friedmanniomyces endolithicus]
MVVGKNNSQNLARAVSSPKLPPLPKLRVRRPNTTDANPCIGVMSSVLGTATPMGAGEEYQIGRDVQQMPRAGLHAAGHHKATVRRAARCWSNRYGRVWMRGYVFGLDPDPLAQVADTWSLAETDGGEEEQYQLPPFAILPADNWAT